MKNLNKGYLLKFMLIVVFLVLLQTKNTGDYTAGVTFKNKEESRAFNTMVRDSMEVQNSGDTYLGEDYEEYLGKYLRRATSRNLGKEEYVASNIRLAVPEYYDTLYDLEELKSKLKVLDSERDELRDKLLGGGAVYNEDGNVLEFNHELDGVLKDEVARIEGEIQELDVKIAEIREEIDAKETEMSQLERVKERAMNFLGIEYELEVADSEISYKRSVIRLITLRNYKNVGRFDFLDSFGYSDEEVQGLKEYLGEPHTVDELIELETLMLSYLTGKNVYSTGGELRFDLGSEVDKDLVMEEIESKWGVD